MGDSDIKTIIVITGPTASGKTSLAIELARKYGGEIISADSRSVFKGIDIASAKPTLVERQGVPHWGFDLVEPSQSFSAFDFKNYAYKKIDEIITRGNIPFIVGGTGLYVDAVLYDYNFSVQADDAIRAKFEAYTVEELQEYCNKNNIKLPENYKNKRYLIRTIERSYSAQTENSSCKKNNSYSYIVVGITTDKEILRPRIEERAKIFIDSGVVDEAKKLADIYGWQSEAMKANAYPIVRKLVNQEIDSDEFVDKITTSDWRLAKRQITFMKRNKDIAWKNLEDARVYLADRLNSL